MAPWQQMRLSSHLLSHLPDSVEYDDAALDARLATVLSAAQIQWPDVVVDPATYFAWVAGRLPANTSIEVGLDGLRLADLYLACACAAGNPKALAAFDRTFLATDSRTSDDVKQALRQKLFVGDGARIKLYAGRGDLARWVRAAMARMTIDEARAQRETPTEEALLDALGVDQANSPELSILKSDARTIVQAAVREAIEALSDRERTLVLQYYIDGVGVTQLGAVYGLDPSNISRQLAKARVTMLATIRRALLRAKQIHGNELESLVDLVRSQLSLTGGLRRQ